LQKLISATTNRKRWILYYITLASILFLGYFQSKIPFIYFQF
jgi:hypothetical protein